MTQLAAARSETLVNRVTAILQEEEEEELGMHDSGTMLIHEENEENSAMQSATMIVHSPIEQASTTIVHLEDHKKEGEEVQVDATTQPPTKSRPLMSVPKLVKPKFFTKKTSSSTTLPEASSSSPLDEAGLRERGRKMREANMSPSPSASPDGHPDNTQSAETSPTRRTKKLPEPPSFTRAFRDRKDSAAVKAYKAMKAIGSSLAHPASNNRHLYTTFTMILDMLYD